MSAPAITIRQAMGTPPATAPAAWMYSPDILVFPTGAPADTGLLTQRYDTAFAQAPVPGAGNYVYVRGKNASSVSQTAMIYAFWAEHDPIAGIFNPLLDPTQWSSTGFTVNGVAKNSVGISATNANDVVLTASPFVWTPQALQTTGGQFCLIIWQDSTGSNPPPFSGMQPFNTLDAVRTYVEANPNVAFLDTAYSGMFVRQYAGQQSNQSTAGSTSTMVSPDLVLFTGAPEFDPALVKHAFGWAFHQAPVSGQANNLYVRGFNTSVGALNTRVSFFYAENNTSATPNPLLNPANWKSDNMTVGGAAQNYVDLTSNTPADLMTNATPLVWTPPAPSSGAHYTLIAWIDNTNGSTPPPFASLPAFGSLASLNEYIQGQRNIASWDTSFNGLFLRQFVGQTPAQPGTGTQTSPDIIVTGPNAAPDASSFATPTSYGSTTLNATVTTNTPNFIYIRAINPNNALQKARVYVYYATTAALGPAGWSQAGFTVAGKTQNWVDLQSSTLNEVLVSTVPIVWLAPGPPDNNAQLVLMAYVDGSSNPQPPALSEVGYIETAAVTQFVATQPPLSWLVLSAKSWATAPTTSFNFPIQVSAAGGMRYIGVQFINIPTDGTLSISVPGPNAANTLSKSSMTIPDSNALVAWPLTFPANFATSMVVNYWQGAAVPPKGSNIVTTVAQPAT